MEKKFYRNLNLNLFAIIIGVFGMTFNLVTLHFGWWDNHYVWLTFTMIISAGLFIVGVENLYFGS